MEHSTQNEGRAFKINEFIELSKLTNGEVSVEELIKLVDLSEKAKENSYSPYSNFRVGCCLLTTEGQFVMGNFYLF
jgi:hypothetical protein